VVDRGRATVIGQPRQRRVVDADGRGHVAPRRQRGQAQRGHPRGVAALVTQAARDAVAEEGRPLAPALSVGGLSLFARRGLLRAPPFALDAHALDAALADLGDERLHVGRGLDLALDRAQPFAQGYQLGQRHLALSRRRGVGRPEAQAQHLFHDDGLAPVGAEALAQAHAARPARVARGRALAHDATLATMSPLARAAATVAARMCAHGPLRSLSRR